MCKLCEGKYETAHIDENGWLHVQVNGTGTKRMFTCFPIHYCPWCGKKIEDELKLPKITPRDWKYQMQEQEVENDLSEEEKAIADKASKMIVDEYGEVIKKL